MRALIVTAGLLLLVGAAAAAAPPPTTIVRSPSPIAAVAQDGDLLGWFSGNGTTCNAVHLTGGGHNYALPTPQTGSLTCHWNLASGVQRLAIAAGASAAIWTLHEHGSAYVITAEIGGEEHEVARLAHQSDGTKWWLGGMDGGGSTLAYSSVDVEYVDPIACGSGGSCAKEIAGGGIELVDAGQKSTLPNSEPALGIAVSNGRIAYVPATSVTAHGAPVSSATATVPVQDVSDGTVISQANPVGVPIAVGLSSQVLAVLSHYNGKKRLTWYDPSSGVKLGGIAVPLSTSPTLAVDDQVIVYRVGGQYLHALDMSTRHSPVVAQTSLGAIGPSLNAGRLVWAESSRTAGRIRAVQVP